MVEDKKPLVDLVHQVVVEEDTLAVLDLVDH